MTEVGLRRLINKNISVLDEMFKWTQQWRRQGGGC